MATATMASVTRTLWSVVLATTASWVVLAPAPVCAARIEFARVATAEGMRRFILVRPDSAPASPRPLVLVLHGYGGSAERALGVDGSISPLSRWVDLADRESLLVAGLEGSPGADGHSSWNDCRADAVRPPHIDDVGYARAVVEKLVAEANADTTRLYAMGMSLGGMMTFRLALELRPRLVAFACMGASMAETTRCAPAEAPVSALIMLGTDDRLVPYQGGAVVEARGGGGRTLPVEAAVRFWCQTDGITAPPDTLPIPHQSGQDDPTRSVRFLYPPGTHGTRVELIRIEHGGHAEPSRTLFHPYAMARIYGPQSHDFECVDEAWDFFRHSTPVER
jgi:polyhydroxybutyrate depolymerase